MTKKWQEKDEMHEGHRLLSVERYFRLLKSSFFSLVILVKSWMKETS